MEKHFDLLITGLQPWNMALGSNCRNMALEFAKTQRVLYVNPPLDWITAWKNENKQDIQHRKKVIQGKRHTLVHVAPNLWVFTPPLILASIQWLPFPLFRMANYINNLRFARKIKWALRQLEFSRFVLLTDSDMFRSFHLPDLLRPVKSIYYTRDNLMTVPYWHKHGQYLEGELMAKCDLVVGNSPQLVEHAKTFNPHAFYIGQGCDAHLFRAAESHIMPGFLQNLQGKIIGYTGVLTSRRLDMELLIDLARKEPTWHFVLVGPEEQCFASSALHDLPNVHFVGNQSPDCLPEWVASFDVCINPQVVNELTSSNYPRKIDEYLAAGKPVVATQTSTMSIFGDTVYLAHDCESFRMQIKKAMREKNPLRMQQRRAMAENHSWANCVQLFYSYCFSTFKPVNP